MRTKRCMPLIDFTCPSCPLFVFGNTKSPSNRVENSLLMYLFKIFHSHLSCLSLNIFSKPKSYFYTHAGHLLKIASAIQYKSRYESRSVVAPMRTRTQFSAILCSKMGTLFGDNSSTDVEGGRASDITAVSHKNVREKYFYTLGEQHSPHSYAHL